MLRETTAVGGCYIPLCAVDDITSSWQGYYGDLWGLGSTLHGVPQGDGSACARGAPLGLGGMPNKVK